MSNRFRPWKIPTKRVSWASMDSRLDKAPPADPGAATLTVVPVEPGDRRGIREFIELPFHLYRGTPQWVPPLRSELRGILERRHPFFRHSEARPLLALRGGAAVGRLTVFENRSFNRTQNRRSARFYHFECRRDPEAATALFEAAAAWARERRLTELVGPYGFSTMDGGGILVEGFSERASMTMMHYHHPYYRGLLESWGFEKERDFYSALLQRDAFMLPDKIRRVAEISLARGRFTVPSFRRKRELLALAGRVGEVYNRSFVTHEDFSPLSEEEIRGLARALLRVTRPSLVKLLLYQGELAGFLLAFPDLSGALQRARGSLGPWNLMDLATEWRRTDRLLVNGAGILPEYQKLGGNALLYYELYRTVMQSGYQSAEMVQIADATTLMLSDMQTLGGRIYKVHRIYRRSL
jgi:hypothetical protein